MKTKLLIFGITGDLSRRKLLPALDAIVKSNAIDQLEIIGVSRRQVEINQLLAEHPSLIDRTSIFTMDLAEASD